MVGPPAPFHGGDRSLPMRRLARTVPHHLCCRTFPASVLNSRIICQVQYSRLRVQEVTSSGFTVQLARHSRSTGSAALIPSDV